MPSKHILRCVSSRVICFALSHTYTYTHAYIHTYIHMIYLSWMQWSRCISFIVTCFNTTANILKVICSARWLSASNDSHYISNCPANDRNLTPLPWRHNGHDSVSNHQPHHCLLNRLFGCRSKKTLKLRVTGLCVGNSPGTGDFPAQMASNAENVSIWWRHRG